MHLKRLSVNRMRAVAHLVLQSGSAAEEKAWTCWPQRQGVSQGLRPCSSETGAYCQARKRLSERFFSIVACLVGRNLDASTDSQWLWKGRRVYLFDGSTVSMPDTAENRREYPLTYNQKANGDGDAIQC
jgi:hypothetical protein